MITIKSNIFSLIALSLSLKYEYNLSAAREMWRGFNQGLHYTDHFKLLSNKLSGINGSVASYYRNIAKESWILSFDVDVKGIYSQKSDGFSFYLLDKPLKDQQISILKGKDVEFDKMLTYQKGFYLYFSGSEATSLYYGIKDSNSKAKTTQSCIRKGSANQFHVTLIAKADVLEIFTANTDKANYNMEKCGTLVISKETKDGFYITMYAQSHSNSFFHINLNHLTFETDIESKGIVYFDNNLQKQPSRIFKKISLMLANSNLLGSHSGLKNDTELSLSALHQEQVNNIERLDSVNHLLALNIEQSEEIFSYFDKQEELDSAYLESVIGSIDKWMNETTQQILTISEDASSIMSELKKFDLKSIYKKTEKAIFELDKNLAAHNLVLERFKHLSNTTQHNLNFIQQKRAYFLSFPQIVSEYLKRNSGKRYAKYQMVVFSVLCFVGVIIVISLTSILLRLKMTQRRKLFE